MGVRDIAMIAAIRALWVASTLTDADLAQISFRFGLNGYMIEG